MFVTGHGRFAMPDPRRPIARTIDVHTYKPANASPKTPVVVVMHGRKRNPDEYRDQWAASAERHGFAVVAPGFSEEQYAHPQEYNYGGMVDAHGNPRPRDAWIFGAVDAVFLEACRRLDVACDRYMLYGHSAGGQLVHRLATFAWSPLIERAVTANAGSYTMPVRDEAFPFGLGGMSVSDDELRAFFSRPLLVMLGDRDCDPADDQLPREPGAMRQGPHRFARGHRYMDVAKREAARLGVALAWRMALAPGVAHSNEMMAPHASRELFGG